MLPAHTGMNYQNPVIHALLVTHTITQLSNVKQLIPSILVQQDILLILHLSFVNQLLQVVHQAILIIIQLKNVIQ